MSLCVIPYMSYKPVAVEAAILLMSSFVKYAFFGLPVVPAVVKTFTNLSSGTGTSNGVNMLSYPEPPYERSARTVVWEVESVRALPTRSNHLTNILSVNKMNAI